MRFSTTDGKAYDVLDMCAFCQMDTGGNHEAHCPCATPFYNKLARHDNYFEVVFDMALADIINVVGDKLKGWKESDHEGEKYLFSGKVS